MMLKIKKFGMATIVLLASAGVAWASCGGTEIKVNEAVGEAAESVVKKLAEAAGAIMALDNLETNALISSIKVATKQIEASGEKSNAAMVQSEQSVAAVAKEIADKELVDKVVQDFMSQGHDPCGQSEATQKLATAEAATRASIPQRVRAEVEAGQGRYGSPAESLKAREKRHQDLFCTQSEVDSGACMRVGKIPGGDSNAALIFSTDKSPEVVAAKNATINNIIGLPDKPLPAGAANTPEGEAYIMEKKKKDSFLAFSMYSLKSVQAENENYKPVLDARIGQFFGTPQAEEWAKSQASQAQRGILVDLVKMQGIQLKLRERRLRENMRIEANLAALLELENQKINGALAQRAAEQAQAEASSRKVGN